MHSFSLLDYPYIINHQRDILRLNTQNMLLNNISNPALDFSRDFLFSKSDYLTLVADGKNDKVICLIHFYNTTAYLSFLLTPNLQSSIPLLLLNELCKQCEHNGIRHLLADVNENHDVYELLRRAGFLKYGSQRIWKIFHGLQQGNSTSLSWRSVQKIDLPAVQSFYNRLLPSTEKALQPWRSQQEMLYCIKQNGIVVGVATLHKHLDRIFIWPLIDSSLTKDTRAIFLSLISPWINAHCTIYNAVRSYQEYLEDIITDLGEQVLPRQLLMVRHMVEFQPVKLPLIAQSMNGKRQPETTAPFSHFKK